MLVMGALVYVAIVLRKEPVAVSQAWIVPLAWDVRSVVVLCERVRESVACDCEGSVDVVPPPPDRGAQREEAGGCIGVVLGVLILFIVLCA